MGKNKDFYKLLKKVSVDEIEQAYVFFRYKYPKLVLLVLSIALAYYLFTNPAITAFMQSFQSLSYLGVFIAGLLFSFGFFTPFAIGLFIALQPQNILLASIIGGVGSLISDMAIFKFVKFSFIDEFEELKHEKIVGKIKSMIRQNIGLKASTYLLYLFTGIIIASPLPDEVGIAMIAGLTEVKPSLLAITSFVLHTIGIFVILYLFA